MRKIVLYTAIFGRVNRFLIPQISDMRADRFCFTNKNMKSRFYKIRYMRLRGIRSNVLKQRYIKICIPPEIFNNYEYSIYIDCKRPFHIDFNQLLSALEPGSDFLTRPHRKRSCIYDEGEFCVKKKKADKKEVERQLSFYKAEGYPEKNGLHASGLLLRRHTQQVKEFGELWWEQVKKYSHRDQISLPYVAWKHDFKISLHSGRPK